ncbi:hypothetical protein LCGC14_0811340 [marine sediment metagenome]|uniref:Uncharacterized protein n=1 Tax=marine sediment metagenome TaxID=412755 RepID=A0A0F9STY5_9ZZZZ
MSENRLDTRIRLERYSRRTGEDVWGSFVELRERHKAAGRSVSEAWSEALAAYPADKYPAEVPSEVSLEAGPREERSTVSLRHGSADSHRMPGPASSNSSELVEIDWDALLGQMDSESTLGSVFDGEGRVDFRAQLEWVIEKMTCSGVKSDDAPCAGAWGMLRQCRDDSAFRKTIYTTALSKLMPDKKSFESERRFYDDGRVMLDFIERIRQESVDAKYECAGV